MHINCIICSDLISSNEIFSTICGHMFHYLCLVQWIERSETCPQCRQKVSQESIHRVYFNVPYSEGVEDDAVDLQSRLDGMGFQLKLKDTKIKKYKEKFKTAKKQSKRRKRKLIDFNRKSKQLTLKLMKIRTKMNDYKKQNDELKQEIEEMQFQFGENIESII